MEPVSADQAATALAQIRDHQDHLLGQPPLPSWFWAATGVTSVIFAAAVESRRPAFIAIGSVVFALAIGIIVITCVRRQRVKPRTELMGVRGGLSIAGLVIGLVAFGLAMGFILQASGVPYPATISLAAVAVAMSIFGPVQMRYLQRTMRTAARSDG